MAEANRCDNCHEYLPGGSLTDDERTLGLGRTMPSPEQIAEAFREASEDMAEMRATMAEGAD